MNLLNMLLGNKMLNEQDIATDMLKDSKFEVIALAKAATEIANPSLRRLIDRQLLSAVVQHHELSDIVSAKNWLQPYLAPHQQVRQDINMTDSIRNS